jgi:hypothetical protein
LSVNQCRKIYTSQSIDGEKLAIVTQKHKQHVTGFSGYTMRKICRLFFPIHRFDPKYNLQEKMMDFVKILYRMLMFFYSL